MRLKQSETELTKQITDYLKITGWSVYKIYNGAVPQRAIGNKIIFRKKPKEYKGVSDILGIKGKIMIFCEVKSESGKLSENQKEFKALVDKVEKVLAITAKSLDDILQIIK